MKVVNPALFPNNANSFGGDSPENKNYYHPEQLGQAKREFVEYYEHQRYHESLEDLNPADIYYGRKEASIKLREKIK